MARDGGWFASLKDPFVPIIEQTTTVVSVAAVPVVANGRSWRDAVLNPLTMRFISFGMALSIWEFAGRIPLSPAFPTFLETLNALLAMLGDGSLVKAFIITLKPLLIGLVISVVLGVGLGVFMGLNRFGEWLIAPIFIIAQAAPLAALIPVLTFAYGIGLTSKVVTVCIMAMPIIVLNSLGAVRSTPNSLTEMGRSYMGTRWQIITRIILPSASPIIFAGLRLGSAAAFIGVILAELLITPTGIGDLISYNQSIADYPKMYAAILSILVFSVTFVEFLGWLEMVMFRPEKRTQ
jgi:ABC-type nitrate/sulfonate/bicarbonate transport system permease component